MYKKIFKRNLTVLLDQKGLMRWSCRPSVCLSVRPSRINRVSCQVEHTIAVHVMHSNKCSFFASIYIIYYYNISRGF